MISKFLRISIVIPSLSLTFCLPGINPVISEPLQLSQFTTDETPNTVFIPGERIRGNNHNKSSGNTTATLQSSIIFIPADVTIKANPLAITLYDNSFEDGDEVKVSVNGISPPGLENVLLTNAGKTFYVTLQSGVNTIAVTALNEGIGSPNTATLVVTSSQVVSGSNVLDANQDAGSTTSFTLQFPQVGVSAFRYPLSALHILEAQLLSFPRIVTIDRPGAGRRRRQSIKNYLDNGGTVSSRGEDYDEYPQAVFSENAGNAHVRPINASDNRGSGASIGNQIRPYANGDVVEIVVTP